MINTYNETLFRKVTGRNIMLQKDGGSLKAYYLGKEVKLQRLCCMIPSTWHSGKDETIAMLKRSVTSQS